MNDIDEIMYLIDWSRTDKEQEKGINMARNVSCLRAFFQPFGLGYDKSVWDNCALVICERSDDELEPYVLDMLLWLEDLNWPGAALIQQRLMQFCKVDTLVSNLHVLVPVLELLQRDVWLTFLADLLSNAELRNALNCDVLQILNNHYVEA